MSGVARRLHSVKSRRRHVQRLPGKHRRNGVQALRSRCQKPRTFTYAADIEQATDKLAFLLRGIPQTSARSTTSSGKLFQGVLLLPPLLCPPPAKTGALRTSSNMARGRRGTPSFVVESSDSFFDSKFREDPTITVLSPMQHGTIKVDFQGGGSGSRLSRRKPPWAGRS